MPTWLLPRTDLTPSQLSVVEMPPYEHGVVLGPPGSGKTQVLIHRAAHLAQSFRVSPDRFRIFVFTNVIKEYIRSGFSLLNIPDDTVCTFDHWCRLLYQRYISKQLPWSKADRTFDFQQIRTSVLSLLQTKQNLQKSLDFALVDEGQDLTPQVYEILCLAAKHITVFADPQQKIFQEGASETYILKILGLNRRNATLLEDYRNSPYVAQLASYFIADRNLRSQYLNRIHAVQQVRERPLLFIASSLDQEIDRLAEIVHQRQLMNERVGIIVATNRQLHGITKGLEKRGIEVEKAIRRYSSNAVEVLCDFGNMAPKIATFYMAKGLTFDSVLLPRLSNSSFPGTRGEARQRIVFVGIARATQWAYLSTLKESGLDEMEILREASRNGHLTIQEAGTPPEASRRAKPEPHPQEEDEFSVN